MKSSAFTLNQQVFPESSGKTIATDSKRDPFVVPTDENIVLSISGGRTSGYLLRRVIDANGGQLPSNCQAIFQNTGKEQEPTYRFLRDMALSWGVEITWLEYGGKKQFRVVNFNTADRKGKPFEQMIIDQGYYLPNPFQRLCTKHLKNITMSLYCKEYLGWNTFQNWLGIRADEPKRFGIEGASQTNRIIQEEKYLPLRWANVQKSEILTWWQHQHFDLALGPNESNCDLCIMKGIDNVLTMIRQNPDRAVYRY